MLSRSAFVASAAASLVAFRAEASASPLVTLRGEAAMLPHGAGPGRGPRPDAVPFRVLVDATTAQYEHTFANLVPYGWTLVSLDVYGAVGQERYAAVFVQRPAFSWIGLNGLTLKQLESQLNTFAQQGYVPTIFAVSGDAAHQTCAVKMEQSYAYWYYALGIAQGSQNQQGTFAYYDALYRSQNYDLAALAVYGDASAPLYVAAWAGNGTATPWADAPADTAQTLEATLDAEQRAGLRPSLIARNAYGTYASVFRGNRVGPYTVGYELDAARFNALYTKMTAKGYYPISLRAGDLTGKPVYAAVFAATDQPIPKPRTLTVTGSPVSAYGAIENAIVAFMQTNGVRAGQLTVAQNGAVQYERAFTWAETGYPVTQPSSLFRLASVSKAFVEAAVQTLYDQGTLQPSTLVFPTLGFSHPGDPRSDTITVQELLDHKGGYDDTVVPDPLFSMRAIALDLGLKKPIDAEQFVRWIYAQPLQYTPGTKSVYSNTGYAILSYLVAHVTKMPFIAFVQGQVMAPLGVTSGVDLSRTARDLRLPGEVTYDDDEVGLSALTVTSPVLQPDAYGGDQMLCEVAQGASSIATSATAVATLIHTWLVWGNGPRWAPGNWYLQRDGSMPGTTSVAGSRGNDGFDFCFIFNTRNWPPGASPSPPDDLASQINTLLDALDPGARHPARRTVQPLGDGGEPLRRHGRLQRMTQGRSQTR